MLSIFFTKRILFFFFFFQTDFLSVKYIFKLLKLTPKQTFNIRHCSFDHAHLDRLYMHGHIWTCTWPLLSTFQFFGKQNELNSFLKFSRSNEINFQLYFVLESIMSKITCLRVRKVLLFQKLRTTKKYWFLKYAI